VFLNITFELDLHRTALHLSIALHNSVTGFAPIKEIDDPRADMMVKKDVAGFVKKGSLVVGLPRPVWGCGANFGLIPASQQVRLMIGKILSSEGLL
jgi:hypothetical protein